MPRKSRARCSCRSLGPRPLSLLIVEAGAQVPDGFAPRPADFVVLFQQAGESPRAFSQRVAAQHQELTQAGARVERAVVIVGSERSDDVLAARYRVARTLIAGSQTTGARELSFLAPSTHTARHELGALAGALQEGLFGGDFRVTIELTSSTPKSERAGRPVAPLARAAA